MRVVGIGGTLRPGSTSERLVRAVLASCASTGAETQMFGGDALAALPHYNPAQPQRNEMECRLVEAVRVADAVVIGTPGYHGGVSGLVKNAIDLLEDLRTDARPYFDGRAVGLVVSAAGWQAGGVTLAALRGVVHAMRGWPTPVGVMINSVEQAPFDASGALSDESVARAVDAQAAQLVAFARGGVGEFGGNRSVLV